MNKIWLAALICLFPVTSLAADWDVSAHVTQVEPSYVPTSLVFAIDLNAGSCPAGPWLFYYPNAGANNPTENIKALYAGLMAALLTGTLIEITGNNSGCSVTNIHFLNHG
jgi:hypothetical protein